VRAALSARCAATRHAAALCRAVPCLARSPPRARLAAFPSTRSGGAGRKSFGTAFTRAGRGRGGDEDGEGAAAAGRGDGSLAGLFSSITKLNAENKITAKNSWGLTLIDHMGSLVELEGGGKQGGARAAGGCRRAATRAADAAPRRPRQPRARRRSLPPLQQCLRLAAR
jgi:hypothetical protein